MLGLLLMAGLGLAATAIMEHVDSGSEDEAPDDSTGAAEGATDHGSLLDEPDAAQAAGSDDATGHVQDDSDDKDATDDPADAADTDETAIASDTLAGDASHDAVSGHESDGDHSADSQDATDATSAANAHSAPPVMEPASAAAPALHKVFGSDHDDTLTGSARNDLMEGNAGDDKLLGQSGNDHLIGYDTGRDTLFGGTGADTLHGYLVEKPMDDLSYVVEDQQADQLHGGMGRDALYLGGDDVGTGGRGADEFHVSWDVEQGHPAEITDYNPAQDKIFVELTSHHADADMSEAQPGEGTVTTAPMQNGAGTSILLDGHPIAHVLGAMNLQPSDIGLLHA